MKKLTNNQTAKLRSLLVNSNGTIKKSFEESSFNHFASGKSLSVYRSAGFKKSPVHNMKNDLVFRVFEILKLKMVDFNDAPRGGIMGENVKLKRSTKISFNDICLRVVG